MSSKPIMEQTRGRALVAFESALVRLATVGRDPSAWEEGNLLEALGAMTSGDYSSAVDKKPLEQGTDSRSI